MTESLRGKNIHGLDFAGGVGWVRVWGGGKRGCMGNNRGVGGIIGGTGIRALFLFRFFNIYAWMCFPKRRQRASEEDNSSDPTCVHSFPSAFPFLFKTEL